MDSSLSKALIMVAGILLAMLVIAFITFSFRRIGTWAQTSDEELLKEQIEKFNKEYEVYDKDLMYGVDVISCLNKAKSNNDKIAEGYKYGEKVDASYEVKVKFSLKSTLKEAIRVFHIDQVTKKETEYLGKNQISKSVRRLTEIFTVSQIYIDNKKCIGGINMSKNLDICKEDTKVEKGEYTLNATSSNEEIIPLLTLSNEVKQIRKNKEDGAAEAGSWTRAEWETPLYDLKTRKFKCVTINYSDAGRVNYIEFKEL